MQCVLLPSTMSQWAISNDAAGAVAVCNDAEGIYNVAYGATAIEHIVEVNVVFLLFSHLLSLNVLVLFSNIMKNVIQRLELKCDTGSCDQ